MLRWFSRNTEAKKPVPGTLTPQRKKKLAELCRKLGIPVKNYALLDIALTHSSCVDRAAGFTESYERLEFLGDSILNASIACLLYGQNPNFNEGNMSALRSSLVDEKTLSEIAFSCHLLHYINLGKGETLSDSRAREKVAADVVEAVIGVLFLEKGFPRAQAFVQKLLGNEILERLKSGTRDFKTQIQKWAVSRFKQYPVYEIVAERGPDHNKIFEVRVSIQNQFTATGTGRTKKDAEQKAAEKILHQIRTRHPHSRSASGHSQGPGR